MHVIMTMMNTMRKVNKQCITPIVIFKYTYIIIGLFEVQIEPTSTMMTSAATSEDTVPLSQQLPLSVPSSSDGVDASTTTEEGQPWMIEQSAEVSKCRGFVMNTCGCTKQVESLAAHCSQRNIMWICGLKLHF